MATYTSGGLKATIKFNDRTDQYQVKLCPTNKHRADYVRCETVKVKPPASGSRSAHGKRLSVDDPRAMKQAVSAAISFAGDDIKYLADFNRRGSGWLVKPARRSKKGRR